MGGSAYTAYATDRYGLPVPALAYGNYHPDFLRVGAEAYVASKIGINTEALRQSGVIINPSIQFRPGIKPLLHGDSFLPTIYSTPSGHEITSVYGNSIDTHLRTMLALEGISARTATQYSPFSMESLFYDNLGISRGAHFGTLTIGEPRMLKDMWSGLVQEPKRNRDLRLDYWNEYLKNPLTSRLNYPASFANWSGFDALGVSDQIAEEQKSLLINYLIQEVKKNGLDNPTLLFLIRNGLVQQTSQQGSDMELLAQFDAILATFAKQKAQLKFDKRVYGYGWQSNGEDNLFLNVHMFFGELTGLAAQFMIENHGTRQVNFCGTTGAVREDFEIGLPFIPLSFRSDSETSYERINGVHPSDIQGARYGRQMAVPTPLLETLLYLERVRSLNVGDSIDCESVDLVRLCSVYPGLLLKIVLMISDNPYLTDIPETVKYDFQPVLDVFGLPH